MYISCKYHHITQSLYHGRYENLQKVISLDVLYVQFVTQVNISSFIIYRIRMIHQFLPQYAPPHSTFPHPPIHNSNSQSLLIEQLRRENEMLKQQLQVMIHLQTQSPPPTSPRNNFMMTLQAHNLQDEAEVTYRNKMSKLKTKKSNRKSLDHTVTAPCSPKTSYIHTEQRPPSRPEQVPRLMMMGDPRCKVMIISKDKDGKFFRDRSQEEKMMTTRKGNTSQQRKVMQSPNAKCNYVQVNNKENSFAKAGQRNGHQRVESAYPISNQDKTHRICKQTSPTPTLNNIPNKPEFLQSPQYYRNSEFNSNQQRHTACYPFPPQVQRENAEGRVPRGNVYFQKPQEKQKRVQRKQSLGDFASEGDSRLSIEIDLRKARSNRRLNYDIYLQDQNSRS